MTLELNGYGLEIDSHWGYVALSWQVLALAFLSVVAYKSYKAYKKPVA